MGRAFHEIGGDKVSVYAATSGQQIASDQRGGSSRGARNADIAVCSGAELEIGWLPQILVQTSNRRFVPAARALRCRELRQVLDVPLP